MVVSKLDHLVFYFLDQLGTINVTYFKIAGGNDDADSKEGCAKDFVIKFGDCHCDSQLPGTKVPSL